MARLEASAYVRELKTQSPPRKEKIGPAMIALVGRRPLKFPTIIDHDIIKTREAMFSPRIERRPHPSPRKLRGTVIKKSSSS